MTKPATVPDSAPLRPDLGLIADWIPSGANVLDLGCGDGSLLAHLQQHKECTGYGVEIADAEVLACARRGVDVVQQNIEEGLGMFRGGQFDVCVLSMAIQATHRTEKVLREMSEVAAEGIVSFPNFGHWYHVWSIMLGRMPVTREMPYQWYDTPNLHLTTIRDFELFLTKIDLQIVGHAYLDRLNALGLFPGQEQALKALQPAPMTMGELATLLRVKPPTVSKTIGRLSLQGLVTRAGGNRDGRLVQVALTEAGQKTALDLDAVWNQVEDELLERLDGKERKQLRKLLRKAAKGLGKAGAEVEDSETDADEADSDA